MKEATAIVMYQKKESSYLVKSVAFHSAAGLTTCGFMCGTEFELFYQAYEAVLAAAYANGLVIPYYEQFGARCFDIAWGDVCTGIIEKYFYKD